jgi:uncharacterized UBP type Zn finger protein
LPFECNLQRYTSGSTAAPGTRATGFYDLVSVLTHKGRSADSGHYVSWVGRIDRRHFSQRYFANRMRIVKTLLQNT